MQSFIKYLKVAVLTAALSIGTAYVMADWTQPPGAPTPCPNGYPGCDAPINGGGSAQKKSGLFTTNGGLITNGIRSFLDVQIDGHVGINGQAPGATVGGQATGLAVTGYTGLGGLRINGADTINTIYQSTGNLALTTAGGLINLGPAGGATLSVGSNNVGVGTVSPNAALKLGVNGKVGATAYCDVNGANCSVPPFSGGSAPFTISNVPGDTTLTLSPTTIKSDSVGATIKANAGPILATVGSCPTSPTQQFVIGFTATGALNCKDLSSLGIVTGNGTTNVVPKWTSATTLGNSNITDNGSNVLVGNPAKAANLNPWGAFYGGVYTHNFIADAPNGFTYTNNGEAAGKVITAEDSTGVANWQYPTLKVGAGIQIVKTVDANSYVQTVSCGPNAYAVGGGGAWHITDKNGSPNDDTYYLGSMPGQVARDPSTGHLILPVTSDGDAHYWSCIGNGDLLFDGPSASNVSCRAICINVTN